MLIFTQNILHAQFSSMVYMDCITIKYISKDNCKYPFDVVLISAENKYSKTDFTDPTHIYMKINKKAYDNIVFLIKSYENKYRATENVHHEDYYKISHVFYHRDAKSLSIFKIDEQKNFFHEFMKILKISGCTNIEISRIKSQLLSYLNKDYI